MLNKLAIAVNWATATKARCVVSLVIIYIAGFVTYVALF